jgi:DnaJ-class molecular chaperone
MKSLYDILGIKREASQDEIKRAYRKLAQELHPDRTGNDQKKTERFKEVCAAYAILSNETDRANYDNELGTRRHPFAPDPSGKRSSMFGPLFDDLVGRVQTEGIGAHNLDELLKDLLIVAKDVQKNVPNRMKKTAEQATKSPGSLLDMVENIFDAKIAWDKSRDKDGK